MPELELVEQELSEIEKAEKLIADARVAKLTECLAVVNKALADYGCLIGVEVKLGDQWVSASLILSCETRASITLK